MIISPCALSTSFLRYWRNIHLHVTQSLLSAMQILRCTAHSTHVLPTENQHQAWPSVPVSAFYHEFPFMGWKEGQESAWEANDKHCKETKSGRKDSLPHWRSLIPKRPQTSCLGMPWVVRTMRGWGEGSLEVQTFTLALLVLLSQGWHSEIQSEACHCVLLCRLVACLLPFFAPSFLPFFLFSFLAYDGMIYMPLCMCVHIVCVWRVWMEDWGLHLESSSIALYLILWGRASQLNPELANVTSVANQLALGIPCFCLPYLNYKQGTQHSCGFWESKFQSSH